MASARARAKVRILVLGELALFTFCFGVGTLYGRL